MTVHSLGLGILVVWGCLGTHGLLVFGELSAGAPDAGGWRRTNRGWELAEALPGLSVEAEGSRAESTLPASAVVLSHEVYRLHRFLLPVASAGFMACFGIWCLVRWPAEDERTDSPTA